MTTTSPIQTAASTDHYEPYTDHEIREDIDAVSPWISEGTWFYDTVESEFKKLANPDFDTYTFDLVTAKQVHPGNTEPTVETGSRRSDACELRGELQGGYLLGIPKGGTQKIGETVITNTGEFLLLYNSDPVQNQTVSIDPQPINERYQSLHPAQFDLNIEPDGSPIAIYSTTTPMPGGEALIASSTQQSGQSPQDSEPLPMNGFQQLPDEQPHTKTLSSDLDTHETDQLPVDSPHKTFTGDSQEILQRLPTESIQTTVTSPPYDIDKDYGAGYDDRKGIEQWKQMVFNVFREVFRVTKPDGKLVVNIGKSFSSETDERFRFYPLAAHIKHIALAVGFDFWDEVIWNKQGFAGRGGGALMGSYPYPSNFMVTQTHETVLIFRKWVSEQYHETRSIPETGSPARENSALTKERWNQITQSVWEFNGVRQSNTETDHTAVFPEELPKRAIQLYSFRDDTVLDPFAGLGTTGVAAKKAGREYIGIEQNPEFAEHSKQRIDDAEFDKPGYVTPRQVDEADEPDADNGYQESVLDF